MARNGPHGNKFTPERAQKILTAVGVGSTRTLACKYAGIDLETLNNWERRHPDFAAQVIEAEGRAAIGWLAKIEQAANEGTWTAAAWKLERLYPEHYGRPAPTLLAAYPPAPPAVPITRIVVHAPTEPAPTDDHEPVSAGQRPETTGEAAPV